MSSLKRWRQVGQGQFHKWETPGEALEGVWQGQRDGQYGPLGILDTSEGRLSFPLHTALLDRVKQIREGTEVRIVFTGKQTAKNSGREFKAFDVFVASDEDLAADGGDDVPF